MCPTLCTVHVTGGGVRDWFVSGGRTAQDVVSELELLGIHPILGCHQITWPKYKTADADQTRSTALTMQESATKADVFVLIHRERLLDALVEFGFYCQAHTPPRRHAYVLGDPAVMSQSGHYFLPGVTVVKTTEELITDITRLIS